MKTTVWVVSVLMMFLSEAAWSRCKAILINGGGAPTDNYNVHTAQLREMYNALRAQGCSEQDMHVFSASGSATAPDFRLDPTSPSSAYVANPYKFNGQSRVPNLYAADMNTLKTEMSRIASEFTAEDKVFIYVADHGNDNNGKKGFVPWDPNRTGDLFTAEDMQRVLSSTPSQTRVKLWTECCFCGVFNRITRPNTCVATSTDEYHVASYNWTNWEGHARSQISAGNLSSRALFAGEVKNGINSSLNQASRVSIQLTEDDAEYQKQTIQRGCFIGPRTSLEQYMFSTLGFADKQMCLNDLMALTTRTPPRTVSEMCSERSGIAELDNIRNFISHMQTSNSTLSYAERQRIVRYSEQLTRYVERIKRTPEYVRINDLRQRFEAMSEADRITNSRWMQAEVTKAKNKLLRESRLFEALITDQRLLIEGLFLSRATPAQKAEYERKKQCLNEPLVR
jgi:hypothetical protein